jgi:hypothetical protein
MKATKRDSSTGSAVRNLAWRSSGLVERT